MSASNKAADKFQRQIRKRKCDVILTTQQAIAVDITFRRNLEIMNECFPYHKIQMEDGSIGLRKATLWEIEHKKVDSILIKETLYWAETSTQPAPVKWIRFDPKPYFGMYDSDEFVDF
jgi:predicted dinucleotide-utilizing enzyme